MAINKVNTTAEAKNFKFQQNKSTILNISSTNRFVFNGVNVVVEKPKVGDIMCVTRYKDEGGALLPADEQEVIWIDGLSIELNQLSPELEPVGICVSINVNKAIVRYKEEYDNIRWADSWRFELNDIDINTLISKGQTVNIKINGKLQSVYLSLTGVSTRQGFVDRLNECFIKNGVNKFSAELVELDTDLPATDTSDEKDGDSYRNRIIINAIFVGNNYFSGVNITIGKYHYTGTTVKHIKAIDYIYLNNGFDSNYGVYTINKFLFYDGVIPELSEVPEEPLKSINDCIVDKDVFENNENCQILRDNFASYDDYVDSLLVKYPCGAGEIGENPSGKENTYKLSDCKYTKLNGDQEYLYPAARKAASIDVNGPNLKAGNWWLPSPAEMAQMMRDITYETSFWDSKPDIINRVIEKIKKVDDNWTYLSASTSRWTSSISSYDQKYACNYDGYMGLNSCLFANYCMVSPITIYEF